MELRAGKANSHFLAQGQSLMHLGVHGCGEELKIVATQCLGLIHGRVGIAKQRLGIFAVMGECRDPHAAGDLERLPGDQNGLCNIGADLLDRCRNDIAAVRLIGEQDHELIPTQTHDAVGRAHALHHAVGDRLQQGVPGVMSQAIIHQFKVVEIGIYDGHASIVAPGMQCRLRQSVDQ